MEALNGCEHTRSILRGRSLLESLMLCLCSGHASYRCGSCRIAGECQARQPRPSRPAAIQRYAPAAARSRKTPHPHESGNRGGRHSAFARSVPTSRTAGALVMTYRHAVMPGLRRGAQSHRADLQAGSGKQRLLLHLRAGIDRAARDPGASNGIQMPRRWSRSCATWGNNGNLPDTRAATGERSGMDSRSDDHQLPESSSADGGQFFQSPNGEGPQHCLSRVSRCRHA